MSFNIKIDKKAVKDLENKLTKGLKPAKINREMRGAMNQAGRLVVKAQKNAVKNEDRHVAKSIRQRSKVYKEGVVVRIIGPQVYSKDIKAAGETRPSAVVAAEAYDIEFGSSDQVPKPFVRPSLQKTKNQVKRLISDGYVKAVEKLSKSDKI